MNKGQVNSEQDSEKERGRFIAPLEDVIAPVLFVCSIVVTIIALKKWLGLPFWAACVVGVPTAVAGVIGLIWLLSRFSGPRS